MKILILVAYFSLVSCDMSTKPYLKHNLKYSKLEGDCTGATGKFLMNSNTNGERYELEECLDTDFDPSKMLVERKNDTVVVSFKRTNNQQKLYALTIDIDAYPRYNYLTIGERTIRIVQAPN